MKKFVMIVILIASVLSFLEAAPFQTLGILRTPDAYVLPHRAAEMLLVGYYRDVARPRNAASSGFYPYMMAGVGVLDRLELGFFVGDKVKDEPLVYFLNMKLKVVGETTRIPQISVGMDNIFSPQPRHSVHDLKPGDDFYTHPDAAGYEYFSPYFVASKQSIIAGLPWMFNFGIGANRFAGQVARSRNFSGVFMSTEMSPMRDFSMQVEYDGHELNAGLKYFWKNFGFKVGAQALEDLAKGKEGNGYEDNLRLAFGVSYLFDKYSESQRRPNLRQFAADDVLDEPMIVDVGEVPTQPGLVVPPSDQQIPGAEVVISPTTTLPDGTVLPPTGGDVASLTPGTTLLTPGLLTTGGSAAYSQLSPDIRDLLEELRVLREERQKAQKSLEDLRGWIQELKKTQE